MELYLKVAKRARQYMTLFIDLSESYSQYYTWFVNHNSQELFFKSDDSIYETDYTGSMSSSLFSLFWNIIIIGVIIIHT